LYPPDLIISIDFLPKIFIEFTSLLNSTISPVLKKPSSVKEFFVSSGFL
jgi:hypothetical protein